MKKIIKPIQPIKPSPPTKNKPKILQLKSHLNKWLFIIIKITLFISEEIFLITLDVKGLLKPESLMHLSNQH